MNLAEFAAAARDLAARAEASLALDVCRAMADVALPQLQIVTPVLSGALRDSEHIDAVFGSGAFAGAVIAPHIIYAEFRNNGGTITSKGPWPLRNAGTGQVFGRHVTQAGSHYMERGEAAARGPCHAVAERVTAQYFHL